ncbi:hypothetical protein DM01DRAFT_1274988, partial [Hesseltinella vesiculosa]
DLNPIEEAWAKIKNQVRKTPLSTNDDLAGRIQEATRMVTPTDCRGWLRHSISYFGKCLDMAPI